MKEIFEKIHRYEEQAFEEGKPFEFTLDRKENNTDDTDWLCPPVQKIEVGKSYKITVKKYMTQPASGSFDFQDKWNNGNPMPLRVMTGEVKKETRGMFYMTLHGKAEETSTCLVCGKTLTNPVSKLYGVGPECSEKIGLIRLESEEEAKEKLTIIEDQMQNIDWKGWVIKSAITDWEKEE